MDLKVKIGPDWENPVARDSGRHVAGEISLVTRRGIQGEYARGLRVFW